MSKRRHKSRRDNTTENRRRQMRQQRQTQQQAQQPQYNGPFGINPAQLLSMFGNIDMNQINNMLQNLMGNNGGRTDNVNSFNNINNDNNETVINDEMDIFNDDLQKNNRKFQVDINDENMQLLKSIRNIVSVERVPFVDKIIELYAKGAFKD